LSKIKSPAASGRLLSSPNWDNNIEHLQDTVCPLQEIKASAKDTIYDGLLSDFTDTTGRNYGQASHDFGDHYRSLTILTPKAGWNTRNRNEKPHIDFLRHPIDQLYAF
jgi:hypothetical protein